jgi:hypothetical protein
VFTFTSLFLPFDIRLFVQIVFGLMQSRTQSNACARARMALALGKLTTGIHKFRGSGFVGMHVKPITAQEKFNFPRANAILARAQALLWVRDWV